MQPSTTMQETELMEPSSTIQETEWIVPSSTIPQVSVEDRVSDDDSKRNRNIKNDIILAFLALLSFSLIILVIGFS